MTEERFSPVYLGDAVYASFDGWHVWLTTSDGYCTTNQIALEPDVFYALVAYRKRIMDEIREAREPG